MKILAVIPARYGSTRFPGKPLIELEGKTIIQRVWERAASIPELDKLLVATDDSRIADHVESFGGEVVMTSADHRSGTDRIAEVAKQYPTFGGVVNIQGDEPFVKKDQLQLLIATLMTEGTEIATLARPLTEQLDIFNPNVVKVVLNNKGNALYFSRATIPYIRDSDPSSWADLGHHLQHIGLYAFRRSVLMDVTNLPPSVSETLESLEQLRWLDAGKVIKVATTNAPGIGIDTPEDLAFAEQYIRTHGEP
ncbi:MAG: 3-deoxy-manno-octulosonate cytidylyltransferase [Saprospiraceae bacterium]|nr:3-deoxy-manno-octulosonate cytidylyltransferase [Saprospiraceae bacterium]